MVESAAKPGPALIVTVFNIEQLSPGLRLVLPLAAPPGYARGGAPGPSSAACAHAEGWGSSLPVRHRQASEVSVRRNNPGPC
jgi:hypothetical protein